MEFPIRAPKPSPVLASALAPAKERAPVADAQTREPAPDSITQIRHTLIERIWLGLLFIALVGVPASVARAFETGWLNLYSSHIAIGACVVASFMARKHLSYRLRLSILLLLFWAVGLAGLITLGLLGAGTWWLIVSCLLISVLVSMRAGVIAAAAVVTILVLVGAGFITGWLSPSVDANVYIKSPAAWATLLVGMAMMPTVVFQAIASYQRATLDLLGQVEAQRKQIEFMATHDHLTQLPAAPLIMDRLEQALRLIPRTRKKVALLFIDLDGFKTINDVHGHAAGDLVLKEVAARMRIILRADDTLGRLGGDEFVAVLQGVNDAEAALGVASKMISSIGLPITADDLQLGVGASIGVALAPDQGQDAALLIASADQAMYQAKRAGKNRVHMA